MANNVFGAHSDSTGALVLFAPSPADVRIGLATRTGRPLAGVDSVWQLEALTGRVNREPTHRATWRSDSQNRALVTACGVSTAFSHREAVLEISLGFAALFAAHPRA